MDVSKMRMVCRACPHYRVLALPDGKSTLGCLKEDGKRPVDVRTMDRCPRTIGRKRFRKMASRELMKVLARLYAATAASPAYVSLTAMFKKAGGDLSNRRAMLIKAILSLDILEVTAHTMGGYRGKHPQYRWKVKTAGPPSLAMVDRINERMAELEDEKRIRRIERFAEKNAPQLESMSVQKGATRCEVCWMREIPGCRERLQSVGIDCKSININTIMRNGIAVG